jgi:hypothetical protein
MTLEEFSALAEPEGFRTFRVFTRSGWSIEVGHPEFVDIPPEEEPSYVVIYQKVNRSSVPRLVDLGAIDHIEYPNGK